jgi:hypothetical protein
VGTHTVILGKNYPMDEVQRLADLENAELFDDVMPDEIWKCISGFSDYYVSNMARIKKKAKAIKDRRGWSCLVHACTMSASLFNSYDTEGYMKIRLCSDSGQYKTWAVHRLVALAFLPNLENKPQVNHKDGNKKNNVLQNLEWVSQIENTRHAYDTGLAVGVRQKGTPVRCIELDKVYKTMSEASNDLHIDRHIIRKSIRYHRRIGKYSFELVSI